MTTYASTTDIALRWQSLTPAQETVAATLLDDAWDMLTERRASLEADIAAGTVRASTVKRVLCAMVIRVLRNPDGYESESIDDWSGKRNTLAASGLLTVTAQELADISPGTARSRGVRLIANGEV